jgi:hypothetical protein
MCYDPLVLSAMVWDEKGWYVCYVFMFKLTGSILHPCFSLQEILSGYPPSPPLRALASRPQEAGKPRLP